MPPIAVSCGDPAGIGPEVIARSYEPSGTPRFAIGNPAHFDGFGMPVVAIESPTAAPAAMARGLPVLVHDIPGPATPGIPQSAQAAGIVSAIARAVALTQSGEASAVVTAPIHKKALQNGAGFAYPGHTEYLAALGGDVDVVMMLASDALRVVPATIHIALADVPTALTPQVLEQVIRTTAKGLTSDFGILNPRIAIAGLNPHAGEGGAMGREELDWIAPLIERLRGAGLHLTGPSSADTMFHARARTEYDAAICMYHDQALIPIKTLDFDRGVNVTLGLPFIRTSPDHGTAFDIAGKGIANPTSMAAAIDMAAQMVARRAAAKVA